MEVSDSDSQMKPLAEQVFISEIVLQAKIAKRAAEGLPANPGNFDPLEVWCSILLILVAAGNVSKILWPEKRYTARGEKLRKLLSVNELNLLHDRKFRNHFEHYDDRIEQWFKKNSSAAYMDLRIDSFESIWGRDFGNTHRAYNPMTQTLTFRDESVDLAAVLNALEEIRHKCRPFALP